LRLFVKETMDEYPDVFDMLAAKILEKLDLGPKVEFFLIHSD